MILLFLANHPTCYFAIVRFSSRMSVRAQAAHMDVAHTETLTEVHAGLYLIVVLVFIAQAWQV